MSRESYRKHYEFDRNTRYEAYRRAQGQCEICGTSDGLECHHILGVWYAVNFHPEISAVVIKSLANAQIVCQSCHEDIHTGDDDERLTMDEQAYYLFNLQTQAMFNDQDF